MPAVDFSEINPRQLMTSARSSSAVLAVPMSSSPRSSWVIFASSLADPPVIDGCVAALETLSEAGATSIAWFQLIMCSMNV